MATATASTRANAGASKRTAARGETGKFKTTDFRGLKLKVPAKCPGEILFDIGDDNVTSTLRTLLGDKQYVQIREKVVLDKLSLTETVDALTDYLGDIFSKTYGITAGE